MRGMRSIIQQEMVYRGLQMTPIFIAVPLSIGIFTYLAGVFLAMYLVSRDEDLFVADLVRYAGMAISIIALIIWQFL